jgi:hypothetical protein
MGEVSPKSLARMRQKPSSDISLVNRRQLAPRAQGTMVTPPPRERPGVRASPIIRHREHHPGGYRKVWNLPGDRPVGLLCAQEVRNPFEKFWSLQ